MDKKDVSPESLVETFLRHADGRINRRGFLVAGSAAALSAGVPAMLTIEAKAEPYRGEPFSDGTYFDDGTGWVD